MQGEGDQSSFIGTVFVYKETGADSVVKDFGFFTEPTFLPLCFINASICFYSVMTGHMLCTKIEPFV